MDSYGTCGFQDNSIAYGLSGLSLIDSFNCRQISLQNLTFLRSISTLSPLISLRSSLFYPLVLDANQTSTEAALLHISLSALSFQGNIGSGLLAVGPAECRHSGLECEGKHGSEREVGGNCRGE